MLIDGCATSEGTARYRERFEETAAADYFRQAQNLWLSSIGIGTYLGNPDEETDRRYTEAVIRAVELGANVIDTAANYRFQRSELSIGAALTELAGRGFARDADRERIKGHPLHDRKIRRARINDPRARRCSHCPEADG